MFKDQNFDNDDQLILTTTNQKWFKLLAFISFCCALFVNAALIWLLVCRANRLPKTDEQIKKDAAFSQHVKQRRDRYFKKKKMNLKRKLRYLIFGNLKIKSPDLSFNESEASTDELERSYTKDQKSKGYKSDKRNKSKKDKNSFFNFSKRNKKNKMNTDETESLI